MTTPYVTGEVPLDLSIVIDSDLESLLDLMSEGVVGNDLLMDISYKVLRVEDDAACASASDGSPVTSNTRVPQRVAP